MNTKNGEFLKRLRTTFRIEAEEHVRAISSGLSELDKTPDAATRAVVIETVFREVHSFKGAARSVSLQDIESICQSLEGGFAALKRQEIIWSSTLSGLVRRAIDDVAQSVASMDEELTPLARPHIKELIRQLEKMSQNDAPSTKPEEPKVTEPQPKHKSAATSIVSLTPPLSQSERELEETVPLCPPTEEKPSMVETVRMPANKLDSLLLHAEEMIPAGMTAAQRVVDLREINHMLTSWKDEFALWKDRQYIASEPLGSEFLEGNETRLQAVQNQVMAVTQALEQNLRALRRMVDDHLEVMKSVVMLPVAFFVEGFPMFVRDLAGNQGKEAELVIRGAEIEIDKRILDELKDPLIHLIRNCIDHGIEKPAERKRKNKPPCGMIDLSFHVKDDRQVEILVSDDGAGINEDRVRATAIKNGILSRDATEAFNLPEALSLIFQSGFSTSSIITEISGRGLGLAIVREKVEKLGGVVLVETQTDIGVTFRLLAPLTRATFKGILVRAGEHVFMLPSINVTYAARVGQAEIKTVENRATIRFDRSILALVSLNDLLELPLRRDDARPSMGLGAARTAAEHTSVVILTTAEKRIAVRVDEVLGEQEVLVKGLGKQLSRVRNIAGATVLGSGKVVPVLNVADLMKSAVRAVATDRTSATVEEAPAKTGRILVAEDSITARMLLKNILETAGYHVATALDGVDALTQLRSEEFDLVVSDVDMPRMNGFELTSGIRGDKKLGELPVVLVTALESREDKERGIDVGANAYIIKSSFEQSNLLEVIRRLL